MTARSLLRTRWGPMGGATAALVLLAGLLSPLGIGSAADEPIPPGEKDLSQDTSYVETWALDDGTATATDVGVASVTAAAMPLAENLEFVAFSTGCRFFDTRLAGGPFAAGEFRDLSVLDDDNLPAGLGPCGVPSHAQGVQLSLSTLAGSPTGTGYTRLGHGGTPPTATVLQFTQGQPVSVTTNTSLDAAKQVRVASLGAGAGYVGDLLGYWQEPIHGYVKYDGTVVWGTGILEVGKIPPGTFFVAMDRDVYPGCSPIATPFHIGSDSIIHVSPAYLEGGIADPSTWIFYVKTYGSTPDPSVGFTFVVQC